jgi:hypothetical protein
MKKEYPLVIAMILLLQTTFTSCKKLESADTKIEPTPTVTNFKQIKADPSFDWKSTRNVTLNIAATSTPIVITNTLIVKTETGVVIYKKLQKMNETFTTNLLLPSSLKKVVVVYGSIVKTLEISNNKIDFNFITETTVVE